MGILSDLYQINFYTIADGETHKIYYDKRKGEIWPDIMQNVEEKFGKNQLRGIHRVIDLVEKRNRIKLA